MRILSIATATAMLSGTLVAGAGVATAPAQATTTVNMESVVKAAQWDPYKPDQSITPGAGDDVKPVEQALAAKDMLAKKYVDGHFGTSTIAAYKKYQKSLGYSGLAASGLPGKTSLAKLGKGRYELNHVIGPGDKVSDPGATVNLVLWAIPGAAIQLIGGPKRQMGILLATGLLIATPNAGWLVLGALLIRAVYRKVRGPQGETELFLVGAGIIAGDSIAATAQIVRS